MAAQDLQADLLKPGNLESFKTDPKPALDRHGIELSDEQHANLKKYLDSHDLSTLQLLVAHPALHTMVITQ